MSPSLLESLGRGLRAGQAPDLLRLRTQDIALGCYDSPRWGGDPLSPIHCPRSPIVYLANEAIRLSWCHLTPEVDCPPSGQPGCVLRTVFTEAQMRLLDWEEVAERVKGLL